MNKDYRFHFRAWDGTKYHYFSFDQNPKYWGLQDGWQIEKCTGVRDSKGQLIYEGDILRQERIDNCFGGPREIETIMVGEPEYYELSPQSSGGPDGDYPIVWQEIVGNAKENPELLKLI